MKRWLCRIAACAWMAQAALTASAAEPAPADFDGFERQVKAALAPLAGQAVTGLKLLHLSADLGPWLDTGLAVKPGEQLTLVLDGRTWLSRQHQMFLEPPIQVWRRIGEKGEISRAARHTDTFTAVQAGTLQLKNLPTRWLDRQGRYQGEPAVVNPDAGGGTHVAVIRWKAGTDVAAVLGQLAAQANAPAWLAAETRRLAAPTQAPEGWQFLWELGPADIFSTVAASNDGGPQGPRLGVHTHKDVAILQKNVSLAFTPETRLQWAWKLDALPALAAENTAATHDYLSIAVEFDNGQDITYLWSKELPVGLSFRCPLEGWKHRETHIVARSGSGDLRKWLQESVDLWGDYRKAVGGAMPRRITRVWVIANSVFGRQEGRAQFADIGLRQGASVRKVW